MCAPGFVGRLGRRLFRLFATRFGTGTNGPATGHAGACYRRLVTSAPTIDVRAALGVARLGEADLAGWWSSQGMTETGRYILEDLFPRTWPVAGAELAVLCAAKRHHD